MLFMKSDQTHDLGHLSMVIHDDHDLRLPDDHNTTDYVSFSPKKSMMGPLLTGTESNHDGFGTNLKDVSEVLTLYNVDTAAMLKKWDNLKKSGQMYDLLDWNCARGAIEVFNAGYPNCVVPEAPLWTPESAFQYIKQLQPRVNSDVTDPKSVPLETIHSRQIEPPPTGVSVVVVVVIVLAAFFGTLLLAVLGGLIVIMKIRGDAERKLDGALARLLISAAAQNMGNTKSKGAVHDINLAIHHQKSGKASEAEFSEWAKENNMSAKQAKILWKELDANHDKTLSKEEWNKFIKHRPHLNFLVARMKSVAPTQCRESV